MNSALLQQFQEPLNNERGATAAMVAITLTVLLGMAAAALDIGHALVARNELQNVADAGALAGARALGILYEGMPTADRATYSVSGGDAAGIHSAVQETAVLNSAAGVNVVVNNADIQIGLWNAATRTFTPTANQPRAVRVISRRDSSGNGPISTFLASIIGMRSISVNAVATAELTAIASSPPGALDLPIAISEYFFSQYGCGDSIMVYPSNGTPESCAGFTTFDQAPSNNATMRQIIDGMVNGTYETPATTAGETSLNFINGTLSNGTWNSLVTLFQQRSAGTGYWDAMVPVYQGDDCSPNGAISIVGYANMRITNVNGQPGATITGNVQCPQFEAGAGGGGPAFGVFTTLPGLVE